MTVLCTLFIKSEMTFKLHDHSKNLINMVTIHKKQLQTLAWQGAKKEMLFPLTKML